MGPPCSSKIRLVTDSQRIQKRLWEAKNGVLGGLSATLLPTRSSDSFFASDLGRPLEVSAVRRTFLLHDQNGAATVR